MKTLLFVLATISLAACSLSSPAGSSASATSPSQIPIRAGEPPPTLTEDVVPKFRARTRAELIRDLGLDHERIFSASSRFSRNLSRREVRPRDQQDSWERIQWLDKTLQVVRGYGLSANDPLDAWLAISKEELIDSFLAKPEFAESVFYFNQYWFGHFKGFFLRDPEGNFNSLRLSEISASGPTLLRSALNVAANEDYLQALFSEQTPAYETPLGTPYVGTATGETPEAMRQRLIKEFREKYILAAKDRVDQNPQMPTAEYCKIGFELFTPFFTFLSSASLPINLFYQYIYPLNEEIAPECNSLNPVSTDRREVWARAVSWFDQVIELYRGLEPSVYSVHALQDLKTIDYQSIMTNVRYSTWGDEFTSRVLVNSSTNLNRKRSAYFLKRFFCEDLTPVGVEIPEHTEGGQHGSAPGCFACHYKLDPMAGFFKDMMGYTFYEVPKASVLFFSDGATVRKEDYLKNWASPAGSARKYNVGYIRSVNEEKLNTYGENFGDLLKILGSAKEVRSCMTQRTLEYILGTGQMFDRGYQEQLARDFSKDAAQENSGVAYKKLVKKVLLSHAFAQVDPDPQQCYDYPENQNPEGRPPCAVAYILKSNCTGCHHGVENNGRLNLELWQETAPGRWGFPHLDENGTQRDPLETFRRMSERISATDPQVRMPKNKTMDASQREDLFLWLQKQLSAEENQ